MIQDPYKRNDIRILVEVKGTSSFPYHSWKPKKAQAVMCQLIHQTALALVSDMWQDEILIASATADMWYFMRVCDLSANATSPVRLSVEECLVHPIAFNVDGPDIAALNFIIAFLTSYLL